MTLCIPVSLGIHVLLSACVSLGVNVPLDVGVSLGICIYCSPFQMLNPLTDGIKLRCFHLCIIK